MPKILKNFMHPKAEPYQFPDTDELVVEPEPDPKPEKAVKKPKRDPQKPIDYAKLQADAILQDARNEADELLEKARQEAEEEIKKIEQEARDEGYRAGYDEGLAAAEEQNRQQQEKQAAELEDSVGRFLEQAGRAQEEFMSQTADELRDLAIAIAEKVIRVSLKSSGEVVSRMILAAIEKRKRKEWVHIYIAGCDAKVMAQAPPTLAAALAGLSNRVRIIPMADDESGTCIVEMPDEIIDASVSTQMSNIKTVLADSAPRETERTTVFDPKF